MNTGVELLLKRMETNPDDFVYSPHSGGMSRWMRLVDHAIGEELLTLEEHDAIKAGLKEVKRLRFTEMVMTELAGVEDEPSEEGKSLTSSIGMGKQLYPNGIGGNATWSNTAVSNVADAQRYQAEMMRQHLDAHRKAIKTVEVKKKANITYTKTMTNNGTEVTEDSTGRIFLNGVLVK